jgi:hypothetical protein
MQERERERERKPQSCRTFRREKSSEAAENMSAATISASVGVRTTSETTSYANPYMKMTTKHQQIISEQG